jgi:hypothetical protein
VQLHTLKFENLLANPEKELKDVCDFLQLGYNPIMLNGTASNRIHSDYRQDQINPEKATLDAEALAIGKLVEEELAYLDYNLSGH